MQLLVNDLRIEKRRLAVAVAFMSGMRIEGELFVQASAHYPGALEDAPEILNSNDSYFPLALQTGETLLVAKDNVRTVIVPRRDIHDDASLGIHMRVEVALRDAERLSGSLFIEPVAGASRLLDFLNRHQERFLTLFGRESAILINRALIERVRALS